MSGDVHVRFCESGEVRLLPATHLIICFELREDAERLMDVLGKRLARFALALEPTKTRLVPFSRPPPAETRGSGPGAFDFLGFTLFWRRTRRGGWHVGCKTRYARLRRAIEAVYDWCRRHRHEPVGVQHAALTRRLRGHFQYFAVLCRRSQKKRLTWPRFVDLLRDFPLPVSRVYVRIWGT
jgi:hypothetical protein